MAGFTHFSKHALHRMGQRSQLNFFTLAGLLDQDLAINISPASCLDKRHLLFYSEIDDCCFVAIQDSVTGSVITVLPIDYHENLAWKVTPNQIEDAKSSAKSQTSGFNAHKKRPEVIVVKVRFANHDSRPKTKSLTKFRAADYKGDLFRVLEDRSFESEIKCHCKSKGVAIETVFEVLLTLGNDGDPLIIEWR
jgi:hypothetical protein